MIQLIYFHPAQATGRISFKMGAKCTFEEGIEKFKSIKEGHLFFIFLLDTLADQVYTEIENDGVRVSLQLKDGIQPNLTAMKAERRKMGRVELFSIWGILEFCCREKFVSKLVSLSDDPRLAESPFQLHFATENPVRSCAPR